MTIKALTSVLLMYTFFIQSCDRKEVPFSKINTSTEYHFGDTLLVNNNIDFGIEVNGWPIKPGNEKVIDSSFYTIGENTLDFTLNVDGENKSIRRKIIIYPNNPPKELTYKIIKSYNHGADIYTEGLELYKDFIYETGGEYKKSKLIKYKKENSENRKEYTYTDDIFAEGITILKDTVYGLSYREHKIFKFNPETLELLNVKNTPIDFEGWGMTNDGKSLIMSDGSNNVYYLNPNDYSIEKILQIYTNTGKVIYVNELEYVDGVIYANVFMQDIIIVFDAKTGGVIAKLDLTELSKMHKAQGVLNGIAILKNGNFLVTGKHWDKMYEIKIDKFN